MYTALTPGQILGVPRVDQIDLESPFFQSVIQGNPIDTGGLQSYGAHATVLQPIGQSL
jgi:hypothetical protein